MDITLKALMTELGCTKYPERWDNFYEEVLEKYNSCGNPLATPDYYIDLHDKYGVLENHLDFYKNAAIQIRSSENVSLFLSLLCRAMDDRSEIRKDIRNLDFPKAKIGESPLAYNMIPGLVLCRSIPSFYEYMKSKKVPDDVIFASLKIPEDSVSTYMRKHNGEAGFGSFDWYQLFYDRRLYRIDGLTMEFPARFPGIAKALQNKNGEIIALATNVSLHRDGFPLGSKYHEDEEGSFVASCVETEDAYIGHIYDDRGFVSKEKKTFNKTEWSTLFSGGSGMVSIHIPNGAKFDHETVGQTIERTKEIIKTCFPEFDYKVFFCGSWLLDPNLDTILPEGSNIVRFCKRFKPLAIRDSGDCVFGFVFNMPSSNVDVSTLPENTSLQRALKKYYLDGKAIYETFGYFLP